MDDIVAFGAESENSQVMIIAMPGLRKTQNVKAGFSKGMQEGIDLGVNGLGIKKAKMEGG